MDLNLDNLKREFEQNPVVVLGVGAAVLASAAKLLDAVTAAQGRRAYARQIDHKIKMTQK